MSTSLSLPSKKTDVIDDPNKVRWYFYGEPGVGKTTLASKFRDPLFLCTEEGVGFLSVYKVSIDSWDTFKKVLKMVVDEDPEAERFGTVVVDTVDILFMMCEKHVCEAKGIAHPSDLEWGKGWAALRDEFKIVLAYMARMKQGLVFVGHAQLFEKKERGKAITCMKPSLTNTGSKVIIPLVDVMILCEVAEVQDPADGQFKKVHRCRTEPSEYAYCKDRTGRLPATFPMDYGLLEAYIREEDPHTDTNMKDTDTDE